MSKRHTDALATFRDKYIEAVAHPATWTLLLQEPKHFVLATVVLAVVSQH
jgi:hypothetical protein